LGVFFFFFFFFDWAFKTRVYHADKFVTCGAALHLNAIWGAIRSPTRRRQWMAK
jgi:hypothetical protein